MKPSEAAVEQGARAGALVSLLVPLAALCAVEAALERRAEARSDIGVSCSLGLRTLRSLQLDMARRASKCVLWQPLLCFLRSRFHFAQKRLVGKIGPLV